jgi:poly(3-hydroxybutyrate) depolymerase
MLYQAYQTQSDLMSPFRLLAQAGASLWLAPDRGQPAAQDGRRLEVFSRCG